MSAPPASVERVLKVAAGFQRGSLETEQARPETAKWSFLAWAIAETLAEGKRVFLYGCGATGRLAISLETFCM